MKALRSVSLMWTILVLVCGGASAQDAALSPELMRALLQAKSVYLVSGHVRYYKPKAFVKTQLVDETPFEEPCRKELEKWGRFKMVSSPKDADLIVRVYMRGDTRSAPVISPVVTGNVIYGQRFTILDVVQPSSGKVLWSASKSDARSWSTNTEVAGLVKKLREYVEAQGESVRGVNGAATGAPVDQRR
jgi:hypothetical protein